MEATGSLGLLRRQPKGLVLLVAALLVGVIGWADHRVGWEWSFIASYAAPIVLVAWKTNPPWGGLCAFLCGVTWWGAHYGSHPYASNWSFSFAAAGWWFYFSVLAVAVTAAKSRRASDRSSHPAQEPESALEQEVLRVSELEQQRIGRDLHDGLGPHLTAIGYAMTFLTDDLRKRGQPITAQAEKIQGMVSAAAALTRDLARGIFPAALHEGGLRLALASLAETTTRHTDMSVSFLHTGVPVVMDPEDGIHLYRIAQEALHNAVKHGGARNATIVLSNQDNVLRLTVVNDGRSMSAAPKGAPGMGIRSMRSRARALGGALNIESSASEGVVVSCEMPNRTIRPETPAP